MLSLFQGLFIPEGSGTLTLRGREIALQEGYVYLIPAGLLYNYRCDSHMEQLYFHVNIIQVNGMDLFFGCEEVYERKVSGQYLEKVLALYRSQRMGDSFCLQGILWEELGFFTRMAGVQETRTRIYSEMVEQFFCSHKIRSALEIISAAWPIGACFGKARFQKIPGRKRVCIREAIWNSWYPEGLPPSPAGGQKHCADSGRTGVFRPVFILPSILNG